MFAGRSFHILGALLLISAFPMAAAIFDFDSLPPGTLSTPFTYTVDGIAATFSSPSGAAFQVDSFPIFMTLSGNNLFNVSIPFAVLDITFSQYSTDISLAFGVNAGANPLPYPLTLTAYSGGVGGTFVGSISQTGVILPGGVFPEGVLSFSGSSSFNAVRLSAGAPPTGAPFFVVDNIDFGTAIPEPGSIALVFSGLAGLRVLRRRIAPLR